VALDSKGYESTGLRRSRLYRIETVESLDSLGF